MEELILQRSNGDEASSLSADAHKAGTQLRTRLNSFSKPCSRPNWGRSHRTSMSTAIHSAGIMLLCPVLVIFTWIALEFFSSSLLTAGAELFSIGPWQFTARYMPTVSSSTLTGYTAWLLFQAALYTSLPSRLSTGQLTPAGYLLKYYTNGLLAWTVSHLVAFALVVSGVVNPTVIADNWAGLLVAANVYGFLLSAFAYFKA